MLTFPTRAHLCKFRGFESFHRRLDTHVQQDCGKASLRRSVPFRGTKCWTTGGHISNYPAYSSCRCLHAMIDAIFRASGLGKEASARGWDASFGLVCGPASPTDVAGVFLKTNKTRVLIYTLLEEVPHLTSCGYSMRGERLKVRSGTWDQRFGPSGDRTILITDWSMVVSSLCPK